MNLEEKKLTRQRIGENIKKHRELLGFTKVKVAKELSQKIGKHIDSSALSNWEKGVYSPALSLIHPLSEVLHCEVNDLFNSLEHKKNDIQSYYERLSTRQQDTIKNIIKSQLGITANEKIVSLKLFNQSACARNKNFLDSDDYEIVEFSNPPKTAEFTVKVEGNSMEPLIYDGDIVYINPKAQLQNNDLGLFLYQGEIYIKKLTHLNNKVILHSLNPKYKDIEIDDIDELRVLGRIL